MAGTLERTIIFTDGACSGNPGPGGWGSIVVDPRGNVVELGGPENPTTNNRMEVTAALQALRKVANDPAPILLFTDSTYLIRGITQWIWGWKRKDWKTAEGGEVLNRDLWEQLLRIVAARPEGGKIEWNYVRGHIGNPGNERCDRIAVAYSKGEHPHLYRGSILKYSVDVMDLPETGPLPEMRPKQEKAPAYSYLSYVDGVPRRHRDWPSCERVVKGRSGAKFKKTQSAAEEAEILKGWGVDPSRVQDS